MARPVRKRLDVEEVDADDAPPPLRAADPLRRDLGPAARRGAEIDDALAGLQQAVLVVDLEELECGARAVALALGERHIGVVQLPLEPPLRRGGALARRLDPLLQGAGAGPALLR